MDTKEVRKEGKMLLENLQQLPHKIWRISDYKWH